jgi:outer membrane lipoprotein SlyB
VLDESLLAGAPTPWSAGTKVPSGGPKIDRFEVAAPSRLTAGEELPFTLYGSPAGTASARIDGIKGKVALDEVKPGVYQGSYTVKTRDKIAAHTAVTGTLRLGEQERSAVLGQALEQTSAQRSKSIARPVAAKVPACVDCGTVEAVNRVEHEGEGSYLGMIGGGVAGALLGSQVGQGRGTTVAEVVGAAGGAYAGNEIEKRMKTTTHYEVTVRLQNGGTRMVSYPAEPAFTVGSRVRVDNGTLVQI